jgi:hypothetical protein
MEDEMPLPQDHHELMKLSRDQIQSGSSLPIDQDVLMEFEKGNICTFKEQFPNLTQAIFDRLMVVAETHGKLSEIAARLQNPAATTVTILPFFWAGKVVRAMTMKGMPLPDPVPEPECPDTPAPGGGAQPTPVPSGPYCSWPPLP